MNMKASIASAILLISLSGLAQAAAPCSGLRGAQRTKCLHAELEKSSRDAARAQRKVDRLDRTMKIACGADLVAGTAANRATPPLLGGMAYRAGRIAGNRIMGTRDPCTKVAR